MSKDTPKHTKRRAMRWRDRHIEVTLNPEIDVQNSDAEQRVYDAFFEVYEKNKRWPGTNQIADHLKISNKEWVKKCMVKLVDRGQLACYTETWADTSRCLRRFWVNRAEAERIISVKKHSMTNTANALLEKRRAGEH